MPVSYFKISFDDFSGKNKFMYFKLSRYFSFQISEENYKNAIELNDKYTGRFAIDLNNFDLERLKKSTSARIMLIRPECQLP